MTSRIVKLVPLVVLLCSAILAAAIIPADLAISIGRKELDVHKSQADYANPMMGDPVPGGGTPMILAGLG
jgi:hypothetical protein